MKKISLSFSVICLLLSCGGQDSSVAENSGDSAVAVTGDSIMTMQGILEGIDYMMYIYSEKGDTLKPGIKEVHVIPTIGTEGDSAAIDETMLGIVGLDFMMYSEEFENFDGTMKVYYDAYKTKMVTQFRLLGRNAEGQIQVYSPDGNLLIDRDYEAGNCVKTRKDVYEIDWRFDTEASNLEIPANSIFLTLGAENEYILNLGESMYGNDQENQITSLYELIQKPVFENIFHVNGVAFTGTIHGYFMLRALNPERYFTLRFVDGKLHGIIEIYNEWGEKQLEERFENGVLVETIFELDYSEMGEMAKPVIYLYPESNQLVEVSLNLNGKMTHSYPEYPANGWRVLAKPDGTLYDETGQEYYALFWEGQNAQAFTYSEGTLVKGSETAEFLENSLEILGLNRREANEFIMYWLPQMENNAYNLIHFSTLEYERAAKLTITPSPETLIRVMMIWSPLHGPVEIPQQDLNALTKKRSGFTVVEWGGKKQIYQPEL